MKNILQHILKKPFLVLSIIFVLKIGCAFYYAHLIECSNPGRMLGVLSISTGDTFSYTGAMENFVSNGEYYFFNGHQKVFAGRMPFYSIPYYVFRQAASISTSYDLLVLFQIAVETVAIYLFFLTLSILNIRRLIIIVGSILIVFSPNFFHWANYISVESLSISLIVFFCWSYIDFLDSRSNIKLVRTGIILAFLVGLKAYFILLFLPIGLEFLVFNKYKLFVSESLKSVIKSTVFVSIPLIVLLSPWTIRNYLVLQRFIPLQETTTAGYDFNEADFAYRQFLQSWGGDLTFWEKTSAACYFQPSTIECEFDFPEYALCNSYTLEDVQKVRNDYVRLQEEYSRDLELKVKSDFIQLTNSYKSDRPIRYYVLTPLLLVKKFLAHSGSYYLPIHASNPCYQPWQLIIKLFTSAMYWGTLIFGIVGAYFVLKKKSKGWILVVLPVIIILLFPLIFRSVEWRMFDTMFVPMLVLSIVGVDQILKKFVKLNFL